jgi:GDPmannose 4,6-dehydratase
MFGISDHPCTEETAMHAVTTYGKHKLLAHDFLLDYKSRDNSLSCHSVILFNHESEFRSLNFVSAKIARAAAEVAVNGRTEIEFGNLESSRDWGYADEYMEGLSKIAVSGKDESYLLASGELHSVRELLESAFRVVGYSNFEDFIKTSSAYKRKNETGPIVGHASKVYREFGWRPSVGYQEMIEILVSYQILQIGMSKP